MDPVTQDERMTETPVYPDSLLDLLNPQGFEKRFWELYRSQDWKSRAACYEALEERCEHFFGLRKYADYNTFRNLVARRHKQKRG
jgi:hypothetical protein